MGADDEGVRLLKGAYALETPDDNRSYYREFARHYDQSFADGLGYIYPEAVAARLLAAELPPGRILDVGCGTGLVATHLRAARSDLQIDGADLSPEMLAVAAKKALYDDLFEVDLTGDLCELRSDYAAIISAGTFTHGHLGPGPLVGLVGRCRGGALAVIGVNAQHHETHGFAGFMQNLVAQGAVSSPSYDEVPIYNGADQDHAGDVALVMMFRVC